MTHTTKIKLLLIINDLTVTQLAARCSHRLNKKIYREQVSQHIHGHRRYPELCQPIADELGVTLEQILGKEPIQIAM